VILCQVYGFISVALCKSTVPILIGLVRSMGRFCTNDPPLLCRLFPRPEPPIPTAACGEVSQLNKQRSFSNFRSVPEVMGCCWWHCCVGMYVWYHSLSKL